MLYVLGLVGGSIVEGWDRSDIVGWKQGEKWDRFDSRMEQETGRGVGIGPGEEWDRSDSRMERGRRREIERVAWIGLRDRQIEKSEEKEARLITPTYNNSQRHTPTHSNV
eukprot:1328136-Amorphochlora_amoeboformis.AAC.1